METSAALATVFLHDGVAPPIFPPLGSLAGLDSRAFGLWCALAIHDTSSVTGAALTHRAEALATATTVKLARAPTRRVVRPGDRAACSSATLSQNILAAAAVIGSVATSVMDSADPLPAGKPPDASRR